MNAEWIAFDPRSPLIDTFQVFEPVDKFFYIKVCSHRISFKCNSIYKIL